MNEGRGTYLLMAVWTGIAAGLAFILCSPGFWNRCSHFTVYAGTDPYIVPGMLKGANVTLRKGRIFAFFPDARDNYMPDYYRRDGAPLKLLPTCLRDFDLDKATRLEGTQTYNYKGCMLTVDTAVIAARKLHPLCVRTDGSALYPPVLVSPVRDRHGRLCGYMEPDGRWAPPGQVAAIYPATE
ncbi:MAG: hypothetical protein J6L73_01615 [Muribaculaceae bacterium]|nr:hypothetical protein [Muribaculaceae bacterium]